ncbi:hypothetical protein [Paenibacillus lemnae]|uniref:Peptidase S9 prolyl oligopeptidase catalytic domain-containing protein n=1 Tax=Paenibacillus lemnae TaxID=1330551 RepID=A0A848M603_PAELE|nr:hypothetical protein [Paenibacillus lemnae]NMO96578.1 hypothetical protein [Paenibacillus lemnae]
MNHDHSLLWHTPVFETEMKGQKESPYNMLIRLGTPEYNPERYMNSDLGRRYISSIRYYAENSGEDDPEVLEYWRLTGKGLKKELHNKDDPENKWASYVPSSADDPKRAYQKYPLLFVLHGGGNPIYLSETWGFIHVAAEHEVIVVMPENLEEDSLLQLLSEVKALYPVDSSRVYCTGFSRGGVISSMVTMKNPMLFAASAPCGNYACVNDPFVSDEYVEQLRKCDLPVIIAAGRYEKSQQYPIYSEINLNHYHYSTQKFDPPEARLGFRKPTTMEEKVEMLQRRLYAARCREMSIDEIQAAAFSEDPVARMIGSPLDQTEVRIMGGVKHYIGDFINESGDSWFRMVCIDDIPHWPTPSLPELVWEFFSRFSRDPVTGSIFDTARSKGSKKIKIR